MSQNHLRIPEEELYELYETLADATEAAACGDPNTCASLSSDAKEKVVEIRKNAESLEDGGLQ